MNYQESVKVFACTWDGETTNGTHTQIIIYDILNAVITVNLPCKTEKKLPLESTYINIAAIGIHYACHSTWSVSVLIIITIQDSREISSFISYSKTFL